MFHLLNDTIAWYENDGAANPTFTAADIATSADGAIDVFIADMDGDGDMDILSASGLDDTIAWYENDGAANPTWTAADMQPVLMEQKMFLPQIWMEMEI